MNSKKKKFLAASVAGLLAVSGVMAATDSAYAFWPFKKHKKGSDCCAGKNSCAGKDASGKNSCGGKNSCPGKNSCSGKAGQ